MSLLPPHVLQRTPAPASGSLAEAVQRLAQLRQALADARYADFWAALDEDLVADLVADVAGFEEVMRVRTAVVLGQCMQSVERGVLEGWLGLEGDKFDRFVADVCGWKVEGNTVEIPLSKENEARSTVVRESVKFEQFGRTVRRAFEQPA